MKESLERHTYQQAILISKLDVFIPFICIARIKFWQRQCFCWEYLAPLAPQKDSKAPSMKPF